MGLGTELIAASTIFWNRLAFHLVVGTPGRRATISRSQNRQLSLLSSAAWHLKRPAHTESYPAPTSPECVTGYLAVSARAGKRSRTASSLWAVAARTVRVPVPRKISGRKIMARYPFLFLGVG